MEPQPTDLEPNEAPSIFESAMLVNLRLDDFIDTVIACYMSLQSECKSAPGSRVQESRVQGSSVHGSTSPGCMVKVSGRRIALIRMQITGLPYGKGTSSTSFGQAAASSSAAQVGVDEGQEQILVEFRPRGSDMPHMTVVPAHFTSLDVANVLEVEGCWGAYEHISSGPWADYTMKELQTDPDDPHVIFS